MRDIHEAFREAGKLHGHYCPGLAIGVRAACEAEDILGIDCRGRKDLYCIYESSACYLDGIQWVFNTSLGKGNIISHPTGKTAFSFYDSVTGKSVRMYLRPAKNEMSREALQEHILTAPLEELFEVGETRLPCPERSHGSSVKAVCPICGETAAEDKMVMRDGRLLCADCAGKE